MNGSASLVPRPCLGSRNETVGNICSVFDVLVLFQGNVEPDVALPPASSTGDDMSLYQLKWVEWKGGFVPVVTQVIHVHCLIHSCVYILHLCSTVCM